MSNYNPTNWTTGDVITAELMNKIETALAGVSEAINTAATGAGDSGSLGQRLQDMIEVTNTQPTSPNNEIWIVPNSTRETAVPTYEEFEGLRDSIGSDLDDILDNIATQYNPSSSYAVGDYVIHDNGLYKCKTAIANGETWNSSHWDRVRIGTELKTIFNLLS